MELYIDPGTGSMLFAILIGIVGAVNFAFRSAWVKLKFFLSGGKSQANETDTKIPLVIFSDDKRYWSIFDPICRELSARDFDVQYLTASPDDPALNENLEHFKARFIGEGNTAFAKLNTMKAHVLLSTTPGLDVYQWKRSLEIDRYVHIFHTVGEAQLYRMFGIDYYDAILSAGDAQTQGVRELEELRDLPRKEIITIGAPYMDVIAKRLKENSAPPPEDITVLLAPTWGPSGIFGIYGEKILEELIATGYRIIIRPHPQSFISENEMIDGLMKKYPPSDQLEWNRDVDNFDVLNRASILISDFSGIIFEFSLVYDKPVIFASATIDKAPYDAWWVPNETWTERSLPSIGMNLEASLKKEPLHQIIEMCLNDPTFAQKRRALRAEAWCFPERGASLAADYLIETCQTLSDAQAFQKGGSEQGSSFEAEEVTR